MPRRIARISERERAYVQQVLDAEFRTSAGNIMSKPLEELFARRFNSRFAINFSNGTCTMHAALAAAGVGPGDEVIVPPYTMASTSLAVLHAGAVPIFADIDPHTWNIDPASIEKVLSPRTRAIIPVAIAGLPPDMDPIMEIAARHDLFVLEDDAQCFLGYYKGRVMGSIGHASSFSFQSSKHLTSGEGGMVTTSDEQLAGEIRRFSSLGYATVGAGAGKAKISRETIQDPAFERHVSLGFNYRMPELCAAVVLGQLERIEDLVEMRVASAGLLAQGATGCSWLTPQATPDGYGHSYWTYLLRLDRDDITWYDFRDRYTGLGGDGIYAAWKLTYQEPLFRGARFDPDQSQEYTAGLCPVAEAAQPRLLQFKTNYFDLDEAARQAEILAATIAHFD